MIGSKDAIVCSDTTFDNISLQRVQEWIEKLEQQKEGHSEEDTFQLCDMLGRRLNLTRYSDGIEESLKRKFLVSEYRMGIILRKGQIKTIQKIRENFNSYHSLRMGEGKTFYIMPMISSLLIEGGKLPMMLVPKEQLSLNQASFDETTRKVFGLKARTLEIDPEKAFSPAYVEEIYLHLLEAFEKHCYFVLTPDQLTTVMNLVVALRLERGKHLERITEKAGEMNLSLSKFFQTEEGIKEVLLLERLEKSYFYLRKIENLFDSQGQQPSGIQVAFFADEVDSLFHVTKENNRAIGEKIPFDATVIETTSTLFTLLFQNPHLRELLEKLTRGEKIPDPLFRTWLEEGVKTLNLSSSPEFVDYLLGITSELSKELGPWKGSLEQKKSATLKLLFSVTLPSLLSLIPARNYKFDEEIGHLIVPAELGRSQSGNRFSQEIEIIAIHFLGYLQANLCQSKGDATKDFFTEMINALAFKKPEIYNEIKKNYPRPIELDSETDNIAQWVIQDPACAPYRLAILQEVFEERLMKRYQEQIVLPVQGAITSRFFGGITGTLNPYALPSLLSQKKEQDKGKRDVEVETFIKIAGSHPDGLIHPLKAFDENDIFSFCKELLNDPKIAAIIDEGGYLSRGRSIQDSIQQLGQQNPKAAFLYPDRFENKETKQTTTEFFLKRPNQSPRMISKEEIKEIKEPYITVFSPEYTRGTDLPIRLGNVHYLPSKGTNLQDMGQSIWRGRQTGIGHTPHIHVPQEIYSHQMTLLDFFRWVTTQGLHQQLPAHYLAAQLKIQEIRRKKIGEERNKLSTHEAKKEYWDLENGAMRFLNIRFDQALQKVFYDFNIKEKGTDFEGGFAPTKKTETKEQITKQFAKERELLDRKKQRLVQEARTVFFDLATEEKIEKEIYQNAQGWGQIEEELLAIFLGKETRPQQFELIMKELKEENDPQKKDQIIMHAFFETLVEEISLPKKRDGEEKVEEAVDQVEERIISFLAQKLTDQVGRPDLYEECRYLVKQNLDQAIQEKKSLSELMSPLLESQVISKGAAKDLEFFEDLIQQLRAFKKECRRKELRPIFIVLNRFAEVYQQILSIKDLLSDEEKRFLANYPTDHAQYLPQEIQGSSLQEGMQEQVQEQQQQQQQQHTATSRPKKKKRDSFRSEGFKEWHVQHVLDPKTHLKATFVQCQEMSRVYFTKEADKLLNILGKPQGEPIWTLVINPNQEIILMTKNDYVLFEGQRFPGKDKDLCQVIRPTRNGDFFILQKGESPTKGDEKLALQSVLRFLGHNTPTSTVFI